MKKIYFFVLFFTVTAFTQAQNAAITACNDPTGGVQIHFDQSQNCDLAPGDLAGMSEIGFHSGANQWATVVAWDEGNLTAMNDGNDVFMVHIADLETYYNTTGITNVYFVYNQGPTDANAPWDSEGKDADNDSDGNCDDFFVTLADLTACATSAKDLFFQNDIIIYPNPASDITTISIDNPNNEIFTISLTTLTGQLVKHVSDFNGTTFQLYKENLSSGIYFVKFQSETGQFATEKIVFQ